MENVKTSPFCLATLGQLWIFNFPPMETLSTLVALTKPFACGTQELVQK